MKRLIAAGLLMGMACGAAAEGTVKTRTPAQAVAALVKFTAPKGWTPVEYANGVDPVLRFEHLSDAVQLRAFGAPDSDYPTPKDFMAGPAATEEGAAPAADGTVNVAGKKLALYRRKFSTGVSNPHGPPQPKAPMGTEWFCVLPLKGSRFVVLTYRRSTPAPDMEGKGEKAWREFLKTVKPR